MNYIPKVIPAGLGPKIVDPIKKRIVASVNGIYVVWAQNHEGRMQSVAKVLPGHQSSDGSSTYIPKAHYVGMVRQVNAIARSRF
jgi:hypothetical protein